MANKNKNFFSGRLNAIRKARGKSLDDVFLETGIDKSRWSTYENNHRAPQMDTFIQMAQGMRLNRDELYYLIYGDAYDTVPVRKNRKAVPQD